MWHHLTLLAPSWFSWPVGWSAIDKLTWESPRVPSSCGTRASPCSGFSCCQAQAVGAQASVVMVRGLSCPEEGVILVPGPVIEPVSPALEGGFLTTGSPGKSQRELSMEGLNYFVFFFFFKFFSQNVESQTFDSWRKLSKGWKTKFRKAVLTLLELSLKTVILCFSPLVFVQIWFGKLPLVCTVLRIGAAPTDGQFKNVCIRGSGKRWSTFFI